MPARKSTKAGRAARGLYHSAKISDYRFRKVLWHFVRDDSATGTARATRLSVNSVSAIFRKLRVYFTEAGLFTDFYEGHDPLTHDSGLITTEHSLLAFHIARVRVHNGLKSPATEPDYHFAESHWRYHFHVMARERPSGEVHAMMFGHLMEIIRLCGPIGTRPANRRAGLMAIARQMDQRIAWLERNAPGFNDAALRSGLREAKAVQAHEPQ